MSEGSGGSAGGLTVCVKAAAAGTRAGGGLLWGLAQEWGVCGQRQLPWAEGEGPGLQSGVPAQPGTNASSEPPHFPSIVAFDAALLWEGGHRLRTSSLTPWQSYLNWT